MEEQVQPQQPQPLQSSSPVPVQSSSKSKWMIIVLILLVFVALAGFGGKYVLDQQKLKSITDFEGCQKAGFPVMESYPAQCRTSDGRSFVQQLTAEEQEKLIPPTNPTADWKTYTNTELGFSIQYPSEWFVYDNGTPPCKDGIKRYVFINKTSLKDCFFADLLPADIYIYVDKPYTPLPKSNGFDTYIPYAISGEQGVTNFTTDKSEGPRRTDTRIFVNYNNQGYEISYPNTDLKGNHDQIFDQILSTFKFLDGKQTNLECNNSDMGISVLTPNGWTCETRKEWVTLKSDIFEVNISALGRGPYCGDGGELSEDGCNIKPYYSNDTVRLDMYRIGKENKEIFGTFLKRYSQSSNLAWMSIKYEDMEKRKLTANEKNELIKFIDSITFTPN